MQIIFGFTALALYFQSMAQMVKSCSLKLIALLCVAITLSGCTSFGTHLLPKNREGFGGAMIVSDEQQLVLNIVRIQFEDRPVFLNVDSITTSNSINAGLSGSFSLSSSPSRSVSVNSFSESFSLSRSYGLNPNVSYSDSPTVSYSPLQGEKFMRNILHPISMSDIYLLLSSGWGAARVMAIVFDRIATLQNKGKFSDTLVQDTVPDNREFQAMTNYLSELVRDNVIYFSVGKVDHVTMTSKRRYSFDK